MNQLMMSFNALLDLSNIVYSITCTVTCVYCTHSCSRSWTFKTNRTRQIERENIQTDNLDFEHDWSNSLYSYKIKILACFLLKMVNKINIIAINNSLIIIHTCYSSETSLFQP